MTRTKPGKSSFGSPDQTIHNLVRRLQEAEAALNQTIAQQGDQADRSMVEDLRHVQKTLRETLEQLAVYSNAITERGEDQIRTNAAWATTMAEVSKSLAEAGLDIHAILNLIAQTTASVVGDICVILLVSREDGLLHPVSIYHQNTNLTEYLQQALQPMAQGFNEGFIGEALSKGESVLMAKMTAEELEKAGRSEYIYLVEQFQVTSMLVVPLYSGAEMLGIITLVRENLGPAYTIEDQHMLESLAERAALAISNARLYQDLEYAYQKEQTMRVQLIQAEKYSALARLVASVAHELNNPIQTIQNCMYLLKGELSQYPVSSDYLDMAISEVKRIASLVEQLRGTYRQSKNNAAQPFDLLKILKEVHHLLEPHLLQNSCSWQMDLAGNKVMVNGVADQIKQVFLNISMNAIEAMEPDGGCLSVEVTTSEQPDQVAIAFRDAGPGIPKENLDRLFDPLFTTKEKGTGLGLYISYDIVQRHGGEISVDSQVGSGSTFTVRLPIYHEK